MSIEILLLALGCVLSVVAAFTGVLAVTVAAVGLILLALAMQHRRLR